MIQIFGVILIVFAVADFLLGNFANINLTPFMGPLSGLSPIIFGIIGAGLANYSSDEGSKKKASKKRKR